ncbi:hypothetical protein ACFFHT_02075 [Gallibacterium melopsittaci]|uniref:Uncharacterized protein n=1 Tax=Gallibacterium melopsittaci TaxID=516063 RepID=A0ABV6HU08_9PAST
MITDSEMHELLYSVPDNVDYTTIIEEVDYQDMPLNRINKLLYIIHHEEDFKFHDVLKAAGILCSLGIDNGFKYIKSLVLNKDKYLNDKSYEYLLMTIKSYLVSQTTFGNENKARISIYPCMKEIIRLSEIKRFSIARFYWVIEERDYKEYIPLIKHYLSHVINNYQERYWDIYDASVLLLKLDSEFVIELFKKNNLLLRDFKLTNNNLNDK